MTNNMTFLEQFKQRGYFYQCTNYEGLESKLSEQKIAAYIGFDCTAKSLHVGNLMQIMILRLLQQHGHKPIVIIGGGTTRVGDPTGKDEMRKCLTKEELQQNIAGIRKSLEKFIKFGNGPSDAMLVNNAEWLENIGYIEFLDQVGRLVSVNRMLSMDSVRLRLDREQSLSFLEFNYMLLQAYDFYHLNKEYNCALQLGGSDQWGNIVTGVELVRKMNNQEAFGLTTPLLTTASGAKMGKSVGGAVWLNEEQLSPYDYYQYWRNIEDADIIRFANLYGEVSETQLAELEQLKKSNINEAKKFLAHHLTAICHGQEAADTALATATKVFEQGGVSANLPTIEIAAADLATGINLYDLLLLSGLVSSKGEGRRLIRGGGARINDHQILDENILIDPSFCENNQLKLSSGKKKHALLRVK